MVELVASIVAMCGLTASTASMVGLGASAASIGWVRASTDTTGGLRASPDSMGGLGASTASTGASAASTSGSSAIAGCSGPSEGGALSQVDAVWIRLTALLLATSQRNLVHPAERPPLLLIICKILAPGLPLLLKVLLCFERNACWYFADSAVDCLLALPAARLHPDTTLVVLPAVPPASEVCFLALPAASIEKEKPPIEASRAVGTPPHLLTCPASGKLFSLTRSHARRFSLRGEVSHWR